MKSKLLSLKLLALLAGIFTFSSVKADVIVTWEDVAGDLVVSWNGDISNWSYTSQFTTTFNALQTDNGIHALNGLVDLNWTGSTFNWYTGPHLAFNSGVMVGDSFGTSGLSNWVYMPGNYAGQVIAGSVTWVGQGSLIGNFNAGSRDLGFGTNDNIIFRAASVPDSGATVGLLGLALLGFAGLRRKFVK